MISVKYPEFEDGEMPNGKNILKFIQLTITRAWDKIEQYNVRNFICLLVGFSQVGKSTCAAFVDDEDHKPIMYIHEDNGLPTYAEKIGKGGILGRYNIGTGYAS